MVSGAFLYTCTLEILLQITFSQWPLNCLELQYSFLLVILIFLPIRLLHHCFKCVLWYKILWRELRAKITCVCSPPTGSHWTLWRAWSLSRPVWTMNWCGASLWPSWPQTAVGRWRQEGSASMFWTSMTMHRSFRRRCMWAHWERMSRPSYQWPVSGWVTFLCTLQELEN